MLNLVRPGPSLLKLVQIRPRLLKLVRAGRCLLNLVQADQLVVGGCSSGAALVRGCRGRGRYRRGCGDSLVRYGRGAGQERPFPFLCRVECCTLPSQKAMLVSQVYLPVSWSRREALHGCMDVNGHGYHQHGTKDWRKVLFITEAPDTHNLRFVFMPLCPLHSSPPRKMRDAQKRTADINVCGHNDGRLAAAMVHCSMFMYGPLS